MGKLQRYFWPKAALCFYVDGEAVHAAFGFVEKGAVDVQERRAFPLEQKRKLVEWYEEIRRTYPRTYVAAMLDTINQGALPECGKAAYEKYGVDAALVHTLCMDETWSVYTSLVEMKWFEQKFKGIDFDLLFSPFILLYEKSLPLLTEKPALYLLHQHGTAFLAIFSKGRLWFAQVLVVSEHAEEEIAPMTEEENEELGFDLEMLDEESEIAPITDADVLGSFDSGEGKSGAETEDESALERLEYTLNLFEELKEAIARFYHDDRFPHEFIERVTIFDMDELGSDLARYIEDELFMEAAVKPIDPVEVMARLVPTELEK